MDAKTSATEILEGIKKAGACELILVESLDVQ